jgi:hypothetical protein
MLLSGLSLPAWTLGVLGFALGVGDMVAYTAILTLLSKAVRQIAAAGPWARDRREWLRTRPKPSTQLKRHSSCGWHLRGAAFSMSGLSAAAKEKRRAALAPRNRLAPALCPGREERLVPLSCCARIE